MKNYGLPYKGSKNKIAQWIVDQLPAGGTFYDLFCGGCAITHCAMESGKWNRFVINDIDPMLPQFFVDAVHGKFKDRTEWVSREDFYAKKDNDPLVRFVYSFGNKGNCYLFSSKNEKIKGLAHQMLTAPTWKERRRFYRSFMEALKSDLEFLTKQTAKHVADLQSLERLKRVQSLEGLERVQSLESYSLDYQEVPIDSPGVIYCDIPYAGSDKYACGKFNYERFSEWCGRQNLPVFVSEYNAPSEDFVCIAQIKKTCSLGSNNSKKTLEKIFIPAHQYKPKIEMPQLAQNFDSNQLPLFETSGFELQESA